MTLEESVKIMFSDNYKERFIAEYVQVSARYHKLHNLIIKAEAKTLDFELSCPLFTLQNQASAMGQYLKQLEIRAEIEEILLPIVAI